ncbi:MAG TPA: DNA integrity scanning protein DisA nucleotide-binding domain protein [Candidatus Omnitrophota bacterium]|nr:DNA integrity scanning protein DisA nucleotide-binding domain protein [Candidatus Omnitrophota bacterium]
MLITIIAMIIALGYFFYPPKFAWLKLALKYLIGVFCAWAALLFAVPVVEDRFAHMTGLFILLLAGGLICADMLGSIGLWFVERVWGFLKKSPQLSGYLMEIWTALERMASRKVGALIILQRKQPLRPYMKGGMSFDAEIRSEILVPLFLTSSPVHDGALIVHKGRIQTVKGILPLASLSNLAPNFGTRHRAAIGITEKTDAIALVASEERGQISIAYRGCLVHIRDQEEFFKAMQWVLKGRNILKLKNARFIVTTKILNDLA